MRKCANAIIVAGMLSCAGAARGHEYLYRAVLNGSGASPPNSSVGIGTALITMDLDLAVMEVELSFTDVSGATLPSSIHGKTATSHIGTASAAAPLPNLPTDAHSGSYSETIDLAESPAYTSEFITASGGTVGQAFNALIFGLVDERMYVNLNTSAFPDGEIGGFLQAFPDANRDGTIDTEDFSAVSANFNVLGTELDSGDFNVDGKTNALDFNLLAAHFGESVSFPVNTAPGPGDVVPEASVVALLARSPRVAATKAHS